MPITKARAGLGIDGAIIFTALHLIYHQNFIVNLKHHLYTLQQCDLHFSHFIPCCPSLLQEETNHQLHKTGVATRVPGTTVSK